MNSLKTILKKILPHSLIVQLNSLKSGNNFTLFMYDYFRFRSSYSKSYRSKKEQNLTARIIFSTHSLEKGLSYTNIRYNFGKSALESLHKAMSQYKSLGYSTKTKAWKNALSVLREYSEVHKTNNSNPQFLEAIFYDFTDEIYSDTSNMGGTVLISKESKIDNKIKSFKDLFNGRCSVREYSSRQISLTQLKDCINIATKAPSICNRQTSRVRIVQDENTIESILGIQNGLVGYGTPKSILIVTTDTRSYVSPAEHNQVYIDGGIFAMALLLAIEYEGLAACALNTMFNIKKDRLMRKTLNIGSHENFIMIIAVGHFKDNVKVPKSFRYTADDIITLVDAA